MHDYFLGGTYWVEQSWASESNSSGFIKETLKIYIIYFFLFTMTLCWCHLDMFWKCLIENYSFVHLKIRRLSEYRLELLNFIYGCIHINKHIIRGYNKFHFYSWYVATITSQDLKACHWYWLRFKSVSKIIERIQNQPKFCNDERNEN